MDIKHHYKKPSIEQLRDDLARSEANAAERHHRINECQVEATDCAVSMWASDVNIRLLKDKLELAEAGWMHSYYVLYKDGSPAKGKTWRGQCKFSHNYVTRWLIDGQWMTAYEGPEQLTPRKAKNMAAKGLSWVLMELPSHVVQSFGSYVGAPVSSYFAPDDQEYIVA